MMLDIVRFEDVFFLCLHDENSRTWTRCSVSGVGPCSSQSICAECKHIRMCPIHNFTIGSLKNYIEKIQDKFIWRIPDSLSRVDIIVSKLAQSINSCSSLEEAYIKILETIGDR